jgi:hypothetical protein
LYSGGIPVHLLYASISCAHISSTRNKALFPAQVEEYRMRLEEVGGYSQFYVCMYVCMYACMHACIEDERRIDKT